MEFSEKLFNVIVLDNLKCKRNWKKLGSWKWCKFVEKYYDIFLKFFKNIFIIYLYEIWYLDVFSCVFLINVMYLSFLWLFMYSLFVEWLIVEINYN